MNTAFVLPYLDDRFGGPVTVVKGLGPRLARFGHDVSYWAPGADGDLDGPRHLADVHRYAIDWPHSWRRSKGLARGLKKGVPEADIVHINGFWVHSTYMASRIAFAKGVPYILCPAGTLEPWRLRNGRVKWFKKRLYLSLVARSTMARAACLHACSTQEVEHFRQVGYDGPITLIPNAVDSNEFTPGDTSEAEVYWPELKDRPVVLFMSRLSPEKGLDMLVPLWANLVTSSAHRDAILVIAGPDDRGHRAVVETSIDRHDLRSRVCLTGMVQGQKKLALLRRADVFVLPSYSENFGIVVAEALACGVPVITTTGTPWQQLQEVDAGRWVAPDKSELTSAIGELLDMSESQRRAVGQRGRALVEAHYTWDAAVHKFLTVCKCILKGWPIPLHPEGTGAEAT